MSVKFAILGLLHYQDMHGYRLKTHLERNFGHMWSINYGQIYPNLKRMEEEGLVTKKEVAQAGIPDRKLYSITARGRQAFSAWLASPPERPMLLRDPFLLRFVFLGFGDRDQATEMIDAQIHLVQDQLERRRENMRKWQRQGFYVLKMGELGLLHNEMFLDWLLGVRRDLLKGDADIIEIDGGEEHPEGQG